MEPGGFCLQSVRDFMLQKNGKVKNHQLVAQFKHYLNDPVEKGVNRDKFKDYVNTLATIKLDDNGEKVLVLKKKYREGGSAAGQLSTPTHTGSTPSSSTYPYGGAASPTTPTTPGAPGTPYSPLIPPAYDSYMSPGVDPTRGMYAESSVAYPHTQSPDLPVSSGGGYRNQYQEPLSNVYPTPYNQRPMDRGYQDDYRDVPGSGYQDPYRRGSSGGGYQEPYRHSPRDDFKEPGTLGYQDQYRESPRSAAYQDDYRQSPGNGFQDPYRRGSNSSGGFQESYGQVPRNDFQEVYRHSPAELPLPDQTRRGSYQDNQYQQSPQRRGFEEQDGGRQVPKRLYNDPYRRSPDRGMEAPRRGSEDVYRQSPDVPVEGRRAGFQEGYRNSPERSVEVVEKAQEGPKKETTEEAQGPNKAGEVTEEKEVMSVKERAKHLNKIQSETELQRVQLRKRDPKPKAAHDDDDSSTASVTLTDVEREWMMLSSKCDYHPMAKILLTNPQLAKKPDFTNTALHWAAKHGSSDTVKMIAGTPGVNVNQRSGYTPLHLAALHGHEAIVELLVQCYGADPNIRDYSGKKPKQYLKNSASSKTQQLLQTRRPSSILTSSNTVNTDVFARTGSFSARVKKTTNAISNFIMRPTSSRTSWTSSQENVNEKENRQSPRGTPPPSPRDRAGSFGSILANMRQERSGSIGREVTPPAITVTKDSSDSEMMPPPKAPVRRKKQIRRIESDCDINELEEPSDMPRPVSEPSGLSGLAGTLV